MASTYNFQTVSNAGDWIATATVIDVDDAPYDISNVTAINLALRNERGGIALSGGLGTYTEITDAEAGEFSITVRASAMKNICEGQYEVGVVMIEGADTTQIILGKLPVENGLPK